MIVLLRFALIGLLSYGVIVLAVYLGQRSMQYFPDRDLGDPKLPEALPASVLKIKTEDGLENIAWFSPPADKTAKVFIHFHGNGGNISHRAANAAFYQKLGYGFFLCEYRGYGGNPGKPTEQGLYHDARACVNYLLDNGYRLDQLVFYGESIGSGVAVQMALEFQPRRLVLEAPFSSAADVAKSAYGFLPVDMMMLDRFDSIDKITGIKTSLLVIHGTNDRVVPYRLGKKLFDKAKHPKEFIAVEGGGHSNLYDFKVGPKVVEWLERPHNQGTPK